MVDSEVSRLGVVVTPGGEVIVSLARAAVHLDLHPTDLHHHIIIIIIIIIIIMPASGGQRVVTMVLTGAAP